MASRTSTDVKVRFTGDTSDLEKKLDRLEKEVAGTSREIDTITSSSKKSGKGLEEVTRRANDAGDRFYALSDAMTGSANVMSGLSSGNFIQVGIGLAELARSVSVLATDFVEWGKKAWEAGGEVVKAHLASIAAKGQDIAAMVAHKVATIASTIATQAQTAAQWALNVAMEANPIFLVVAAIAVLTAGVILLYQHFGPFHDAVDKAWQILQGLFDWVQDHWKLLLEILTGPIGLAVVFIIDHFDAIRNGIADVYGFFVNIGDKLYNAIKGPFEDAFSWVKSVYDKTIGPIISALNAVKGTFGGSVDEERRKAIAKATAGLFPEDMPQSERDEILAGKGVKGFASGGVVGGPLGSPQLAIVHGGERVIPNGGGGQTVIVLEMNGREFARALVDESNNSGGLPIRIRAAS